jgi:hypothetical protein
MTGGFLFGRMDCNMAEPTSVLSGWERAMAASERVKDRLRRAAAALERAGIRYAVVGGNAVADYVGRADEGAMRTTRDVDILIRRSDFDAAKLALESDGFIHVFVMDVDVFLDGPNAKPSESVHLLFAGEKVKPEDLAATPNLDEVETAVGVDVGVPFQLVKLEALVRMKLTSWRRKDQVHLLDLINVGQIDATWPARFPTPLADRLQELIDNPNS